MTSPGGPIYLHGYLPPICLLWHDSEEGYSFFLASACQQQSWSGSQRTYGANKKGSRQFSCHFTLEKEIVSSCSSYRSRSGKEAIMNSFYWFHLLFLFILLLPRVELSLHPSQTLAPFPLAILLVQAGGILLYLLCMPPLYWVCAQADFSTSMESWISGGRIPQSYSFPSTIPSFSRRGFA